MKLVRARVKAPEHLPEWAACCDRFMESLYIEATEWSIVGFRKRQADTYCIGCNTRLPAGMDTVDEQGLLCPLEFLDLDEGPIEVPA